MSSGERGAAPNLVSDFVPRIALTPGEPAGIGPDLAIALAQNDWPAEIVVIADPGIIEPRARQLDQRVQLQTYDPAAKPVPAQAGQLLISPVPAAAPVQPGVLNARNSPYVLETLRQACAGCMSGEFDAMLTGPVNKSIICEAGTGFSGHTEFLAEQTGTPLPVMLLVSGPLRVALVTTHMPLRHVAAAITKARLTATLRVLDRGLRDYFGLATPKIAVLGLNPHAGEGGHLGAEEDAIIAPVLETLKAEGLNLRGPLPADTAFLPAELEKADAVLAMYHDQGLPVLKHSGFGNAVNITLGLPIIRTSVDHGTALPLAGTGQAHAGSIEAALGLAIDAVLRRNR